MRILIYTDLHSDDLCAIELLSKYFEDATIVVEDIDELEESPYGLDSCRTFSKFCRIANDLFRRADVHLAEEEYEINEFPEAVFVLSKMTAAAKDFERYVELRCMDLCVMGGSDDPETQERNQSRDLEAWNDFFTLIKGFKAAKRIYSYQCCAGAAKFGFPVYNGNFIREFMQKEGKDASEEACCDLMAVYKFIDVMGYKSLQEKKEDSKKGAKEGTETMEVI